MPAAAAAAGPGSAVADAPAQAAVAVGAGSGTTPQAVDPAAPDYRVDHLDPETGIHLRGIKCGGAAGRWTLRFAGDLGGVMQVEGESVIELDAAGVGRFVTSTRTEVAEEAREFLEVPPARSHGRARLLSGPGHLRLEPVDSDAVVRWDGYRGDAIPTRVEIVPVQAGRHCGGPPALH